MLLREGNLLGMLPLVGMLADRFDCAQLKEHNADVLVSQEGYLHFEDC